MHANIIVMLQKIKVIAVPVCSPFNFEYIRFITEIITPKKDIITAIADIFILDFVLFISISLTYKIINNITDKYIAQQIQ